jgi:hypothetical protein
VLLIKVNMKSVANGCCESHSLYGVVDKAVSLVSTLVMSRAWRALPRAVPQRHLHRPLRWAFTMNVGNAAFMAIDKCPRRQQKRPTKQLSWELASHTKAYLEAQQCMLVIALP